MTVRILVGDALSRLREIPSESVQVCVTSPPYFQLRDYGHPDQLGLERTPLAFLEALWAVFDEVKRVLRPDGLCFVNIGDSYAGSGKGPTGHNGIGDQEQRQGFTGKNAGFNERWGNSPGARKQETSQMIGKRPAVEGVAPKNLLLIPQRFAIGMQDRGWIVRSQIAWCLSGGTQVYVRSQKGDMSMSVKDMSRLKPETLQLWNGERWTRVLRMWESTDDGDPLEIELRSGERIGCTPNHLWPTECGLLHAKDLKVGDRLKRVRLPEPEIPRKPIALDDEDVGWFVGLYLAEGCGGTNALQIASHIKETERFERVKRIAEAFDGSASMHHVGGKSATIRVYGRILRAIIEEYLSGKGAHGKHLTNACWRRSDVFLRGLLDGYLHGDGHWDEQNQRWRLGFARNYEFAADLRTICARLGVSLRLRPRFATLNGKSFPTFRGEIRFTRAATLQPKSDDEIVVIGFSKGRKFWDIEVEDEPHTFALASGILTHNCKTSAMPESVRDRPTSAWEPIWMFSKSRSYFYDADAVRQPWADDRHGASGAVASKFSDRLATFRVDGGITQAPKTAGANLRNYWLLGPQPSSLEHYAGFPPELPKRCILAGTSEKGACPACGAPWARLTEKRERDGFRRTSPDSALRQTNRAATLGVMPGQVSGQYDPHGDSLKRWESVAAGWQPSCTCSRTTTDSTIVRDFVREWYGGNDRVYGVWEASARQAVKGGAYKILLPDLREDRMDGGASSAGNGIQEGQYSSALSRREDDGCQGVRVHPSAGASDGESERVRAGASSGLGERERPRSDPEGARDPSPKRTHWGQPTGEPDGDAAQTARNLSSRERGPGSAESSRVRTSGSQGSDGEFLIPYPPRPCLVLDPFLGSGTTLLVASRLGRDGIGIELSPVYARMAEDRIRRDAGALFPEDIQVTATRQPSLFDEQEAV